MQLSRTPSLLMIAGLCATLAACGGGGDDTPPAVDPPVETLPDISACFTVKPGLRYTIADPDMVDVTSRGEYLKEKFDGAVHQAQVEYFDASSKRARATYWSVEADGVRFWGDYDYTPEGVQATKSVYTGLLVPKTLAPTQTVSIPFTDNNYFTNGGFLAEAEQETWTFEGHETLTQAGRTFTNTCRVKINDDDQPINGSTIVWAAPGYGPIRYQNFDSDGKSRGVSTFDTITEP